MSKKGTKIHKRKDESWKDRYTKIQVQNNDRNIINTSDKFANYAREWLLEKKSTVKYSTYIKYNNNLKLYINPIIGDKNLADIGYDELSMLCNTLLVSGGKTQSGLSSKVVSDCLMVVKAIMRYAVRKKCTIDSSAFEVSVKMKSNPLRVFSVNEQEILLSYLKSNITPVNLGIIISLLTGVRIGEICALKWNDISLENRTICIHKTVQRIQSLEGLNKTVLLITEPKSECSVRQIPIPDILFDILKMYSSDSTFFVLSNSLKCIEPRTLHNHFKNILTDCNINNASFHTLRHTFATRCIEVGFDIKSLSEILGHSNVNITLNRYVHPSMDLKKKNMDKLSSLFTV